MREVTLTGGRTAVTVDPDRGGKITAIRHAGGRNLLAERTWPAPLPAGESSTYGREDLDWLSAYDGGWDVLFPNAGAACEVDGVPLPFHGEASRARWTVERQTPDELVLSTPCRLPLTLRRTVRVGDGVVQVEEEATSHALSDQLVLWGHHPVFPARPGLRIDAPACEVLADEEYAPAYADVPPWARGSWPEVAGIDLSVVPEGNAERYAGLTGLAAPWVAWRDVAAGVGVGIAFDPAVFRCVWLWLECGGTDFPWYGNARYLGLEPQSWWPGSGLAAARKEGAGILVPARGRTSAWVTLAVFAASDRAVRDVSRDGRVTFAPAPPTAGRGADRA